MSIFKTKKLAIITSVYWILLVYIIAALVWWFISLEQQNQQMTDLKHGQLNLDDPYFEGKMAAIQDEERRKTGQYIGEGVTFLALILLGAVFVYRATRRQFRLSLQQQNFMMAITHELKTPIAIAKLNLETLQLRRLDELQQKKLLKNALQETDRLNSLCNNILLASQLDAGSYKLNKMDTNFSAIVEASLGYFQQHFPDRTIEGDVQPGIMLIGEELLLQLLVNNLIENGLKYSPKGKPVHLRLYKTGEELLLQVSDQGLGINEKERRKIFDKFYRIGNEVTRNAKGTGLGLYLCKRIAEDHNAGISVSDNQPNGSIFMVRFKT